MNTCTEAPCGKIESARPRRRVVRAVCGGVVKTAILLLLCAVLALSLVLSVSLEMNRATKHRITTVEGLETLLEGVDVKDYDCILVLGAGLKSDNVTPSDMLYDRVSVACQLYGVMGGAGVPLLMSGDHSGDYNEVAVMKRVATEMGVPSEDVFLDHKGYSTYESLYRAKEVFGAKSVLIVTQEYHLYRALYIARELGMDAVGVSADLRPYRNQTRYDAREMLARFKDLFMAAKGEHEAVTDAFVDLNGNGDLT